MLGIAGCCARRPASNKGKGLAMPTLPDPKHLASAVLILARVVAVSKHEKSKGACRARKPTITLKLAEQTEPKIPVEVRAEE